MNLVARLLAVSLLFSVCAPGAFAGWGDQEKMNKWFDDHKGPYDVQKSGQVQKPGSIQQPGPEITIPKGWDAVKVTKASCKQRLSISADTLFEFDKSTLSPYAEATLKLVGPKILEMGPHPVRIEGHTDSKGEDGYNQNLSERRAERVRNWLLSNHFVKPSSGIEGFGEKNPVAPNTTPDGKDNPHGRQLNRRVEIVVDTCTTLNDDANSLPASPTVPASSAALESTPSTTATTKPADNGFTISDDATDTGPKK